MKQISLRNKVLLLVLVAIIVPAVVYWVLPSSGTALSITRLYNTTLQPGQTVEINITVSDVTDLSSCRVSVAWDPNVLKVTTGGAQGWVDPISGTRYGIKEGPFLRQFTNSTILLINRVNNDDGNITALYNAIIESGVSASGSGVTMIINFTCLQSGPVAIRIVGPREGHASLQSITGDQIAHEDIDGSITADGPPGIWTETWFVTAIGVIIAEIIVVALIILVITRWLRTRTSTESEEIAELAL